MGLVILTMFNMRNSSSGERDRLVVLVLMATFLSSARLSVLPLTVARPLSCAPLIGTFREAQRGGGHDIVRAHGALSLPHFKLVYILCF